MAVSAEQNAFRKLGPDFRDAAIGERTHVEMESLLPGSAVMPCQCCKIAPIATARAAAPGKRHQLALTGEPPFLLAHVALVPMIGVRVLAFQRAESPLSP